MTTAPAETAADALGLTDPGNIRVDVHVSPIDPSTLVAYRLDVYVDTVTGEVLARELRVKYLPFDQWARWSAPVELLPDDDTAALLPKVALP